MRFRTGLSIILATLTVMSAVLCGCSKRPESEQEPKVDTIGPATTVSSEEMSDDELQDALLRLEYSMLSSALSRDDDFENENHTEFINRTYIGDIDSDGRTEMIYGDSCVNILLNVDDNRRQAESFFAQGGKMYLDKDGVLWNTSILTGPSNDDPRKMIAKQRYYKWTDDKWTEVFHCFYEVGQDEGTEYEYYINDTPMTQEEYDAYGFVEYPYPFEKHSACTFDVKYKDCLVRELEIYLSKEYDVFSFEADVKDKNLKKKVIVARSVFGNWYHKLYENKEYAPNYLDELELDKTRSVVFVIDSDDKNVTFTTYGYLGYISNTNYGEISKHYIKIGGSQVFTLMPVDTLESLSKAERAEVLIAVKGHLAEYGYNRVFVKVVDVSEFEGSEILCFGQKEFEWNLLIYRFADGVLKLIENNNYFAENNHAYFMLEYNGLPAILRYYHKVGTTFGGDVYYDYSYDIFRFSSEDTKMILADDELHYTNEDKDATLAAKFFEGLNKYLTFDIVVIYDPFVLTGQQWIPETEIDLGERPQQTVFVENEGEETKTRIGFVEVDTNSWLNFREGAGTDKAKVLVDPANPESFIKLAKGTPVTIIEEITVNDKENPLWYKIQINYGDKTLMGYSSATYIRTQD